LLVITLAYGLKSYASELQTIVIDTVFHISFLECRITLLWLTFTNRGQYTA